MVLHTIVGITIGCIGASVLYENYKSNKPNLKSELCIFIGGFIGGACGLSYDYYMLSSVTDSFLVDDICVAINEIETDDLN